MKERAEYEKHRVTDRDLLRVPQLQDSVWVEFDKETNKPRLKDAHSFPTGSAEVVRSPSGRLFYLKYDKDKNDTKFTQPYLANCPLERLGCQILLESDNTGIARHGGLSH